LYLCRVSFKREKKIIVMVKRGRGSQHTQSFLQEKAENYIDGERERGNCSCRVSFRRWEKILLMVKERGEMVAVEFPSGEGRKLY
jgi:hypothetical protein